MRARKINEKVLKDIKHCQDDVNFIKFKDVDNYFSLVSCPNCDYKQWFSMSGNVNFSESEILTLLNGQIVEKDHKQAKLNRRGKLIWLIDSDNPYPSEVKLSKSGKYYLYKGFAILIKNSLIINNKQRFVTITPKNMIELIDFKCTTVDDVLYAIDYDTSRKTESFCFASLKIGLSL